MAENELIFASLPANKNDIEFIKFSRKLTEIIANGYLYDMNTVMIEAWNRRIDNGK